MKLPELLELGQRFFHAAGRERRFPDLIERDQHGFALTQFHHPVRKAMPSEALKRRFGITKRKSAFTSVSLSDLRRDTNVAGPKCSSLLSARERTRNPGGA